MPRDNIHGWIGSPWGGSPTEYGLPLDDSYLCEQEPEEEEDPEEESLFGTCPPEPEEEEDEYSWLDLRAELDRLDAIDRAEKDREDRDWRHAA